MSDPINVTIDEPIALKEPPVSPQQSERRDDARKTAALAQAEETTLHSAGQRQVNMVWERTQSAIALGVVMTTCAAVSYSLVSMTSNAVAPEWWTIVGLVIGFYFGRTNHARMGDAPPTTAAP